ncbi:MAG: AraC family transcriptional regulator [Epsilonproteobacteria bacterium]|nr:AraC family transcriptional regulator [Campylobacterota bacterium]
MSITLTNYDFLEIAPELFSTHSPRKIGNAKVLKEFGNIHFSYFNTGNGIAYGSFDGYFNEEVHLHSWEMEEQSFLYFNAGETLHFKSISDNRTFDIQPKSMMQGFIQKGLRSLGFYEKNKHYSSHSIVISRELVESFSKETTLSHPLSSPQQMFQIDDYAQMMHTQKILLNQIQNKHIFQGKLQELFVESKLLELVYGTFQKPYLHVKENFSLDDYKALHKAKEIVLNNLITPPSLKELAHLCALNEFKLKKGFKVLFGTTVYGMLHAHRLAEAKKLLEHNDMSVQEAALHVGYKSLSHFSKAFKECYGIFPIQLKKERKYFYNTSL